MKTIFFGSTRLLMCYINQWMEPMCTVGNTGAAASILKQAFIDLSSCLYCEVIHSESGTKLQCKNHCCQAGSWDDPRYQDELIPMCMHSSYVTPVGQSR